MRFSFALIACALIGCGSAGAARDRLADRAAAEFAEECKRADAPTPQAGKVLFRLCDCTTKKIRASVRTGDSQKVVDDKIELARRACLRKIYPQGI
jgi:hypothetical protein